MGGLWTHNKAASKTFISNLQDDYLVVYIHNLVLREEILLKSIYTILPKFSYTDT